jgi:hypothetical protein
MLFKLDLEGESIFCSSPRSIKRLLNLGWRLADPSQTENLLQALKAEESAGKGLDLHPRDPS